MVLFAGLIRCDSPNGCSTLVEPHVARCPGCTKNHGRSPNATGIRGRAAPERLEEAHGTAAEVVHTEPELVPCCGPIGAGCPDGATVDRNLGKRCQPCQRVLDCERARPSRAIPAVRVREAGR